MGESEGFGCSKRVGSEIGTIIQKREAITWLILSNTDDN